VFTGIIEDIATIAEVRSSASGLVLAVDSNLDTAGIALGDSVAVQGACLTVVEVSGRRLAFDVGPETVRATTLGRSRRGQRVHLERALSLGGRLGGHLVTGHVDGVGRIVERRPRGESLELVIEAPEEVRPYLVAKGSLAVDGVSLTVNDPTADRFAVTLVPHTLERTLLGRLSTGQEVNLEADILGKYVRHFSAPGRKGIDEDFLKEHGFL